MQRTMVYLDTEPQFMENAKTGWLEFSGVAITEGQHNNVWYDRGELAKADFNGKYRMMADHSHSVHDIIGIVNEVEYKDDVKLTNGDVVPGWVFRADVRDKEAIDKVKAELWKGVSIGVWANITKNEDKEAPDEQKLVAQDLQLDHIGFVTDPADKNAGLTKIVNSLLSVDETPTGVDEKEKNEMSEDETEAETTETEEEAQVTENAESEEAATPEETASDESAQDNEAAPEKELAEDAEPEGLDLAAEIAALKAQLTKYEDAEAKRQADLTAENDAKRQGLIEAILEMDKTAKPESFEGVELDQVQKVHDFMAAKRNPPSKGTIDTKESVVSQAPAKGADRIKQLFGELSEQEALTVLIERLMSK